MSALLVGYARVSTQDQDLTAQRDALAAFGVPVARTYVDHGLTGTNRDRPGLREALAACRSGDTLVVTKLDRLARSLPDARDILEDLTTREVKLSIGGSVHDPTDPVGRLLFNVLAMVAEFESDLIRLRTKEGMRVAKAKGHLRGRPPKLARARRSIWSCCTAPANTAPPNSATCSASADQPSTESSSATASAASTRALHVRTLHADSGTTSGTQVRVAVLAEADRLTCDARSMDDRLELQRGRRLEDLEQQMRDRALTTSRPSPFSTERR